MSRDFMAWDALDLHLDSGISGSEEHRQTILDVTSKAIQDGNRDPKRVIQAAKRVGRRAHLVENLRAYAMRAIFRVKSSSSVTQIREEQLFEEGSIVELTDRVQVDQIENRILIRELLETLSPQDREIFIRSMEGETAPEVDIAMNLKPRTAEGRLRICKNALRKVLEEKSDRTTYTRGS